MAEIRMPSLADSMVEGTIVRWLKHDGDQVGQGDELVEIETEKATVSVEAEQDGYLQVVCQEGETVAVGSVIAQIGEAPPRPGRVDPDAPAEVVAEPIATNGDADLLAGAGRESSQAPGDAVRVTPLARLLAEKHGLDVSTVVGTGPRGRIRSVDVANNLDLPSRAPVRPSVTPRPQSELAGATEEPTRLQRTVARRMSEAVTVPTFQVETEVTMDRVLELREQLRAQADDGPLPSLNDFFVKASALALREHPRANGSYQDDRFVLHERANVGFAVAAEDALVVPTVLDADRLSLVAIAAETRRLAESVRAGTVTPRELADGTFTISNLGMFGMTSITPVINPPQAAILGVGSVRETLTMTGGEVTVRQVTTLTLTCDHRILYGADAAQFLSRIRGLLEQPLRLLW